MLPGGPSDDEVQRASVERESSRLPLAVPVTLFGLDEHGQAFREATRTVDISKRGAKILTLQNLQTDTHVWIENPGAGKASIAKVIRKGKRLDPQGATEICVRVLELLDPEKIWNLESPPKDWERGFEPPTPSQRLEYLMARERLARPEVLSYEAIETKVPEARAEENLPQPLAPGEPEASPTPYQRTAEPAVSARSEADLASQSSGSNRVMAPQPHVRFPGQTETGEAAKKASPGSRGETRDSLAFAGPTREPVAPSRVAGGEMRDEVDEAVENHTRSARKISESAMEFVNAAADSLARLRASRSKAEAELAAHTEVHRNRLAQIASATEELESRAGSVLEEFQRKLEAALHEFRAKGAGQAGELLKTADSLLKQPVNRLREQGESVTRDAEAAKDSIRAAGEQARARLESAWAEMESSYAVRAEAHEKRLAEISSVGEQFELRAGALLKRAEEALEGSLQAFQQKCAAEKTDLENAAHEVLLSTRKSIEGHAEAAAAGLGEKARETLTMTAAEGRKQAEHTQEALEELARAAGERFDQRLALKSKEQAEIAGRTSEAATNTINLAAEQAVRRLETGEKNIEEGFSKWAEVFQSRMAELFGDMEGLERRSETILRDCQDQLERALQEFLERKTVETGNLEESAHEIVERFGRYSNEQTEATLDKLKEEARAAVRSVEEESQTCLANAKQALECASRAATELYSRRLAQTSSEHNEQPWANADKVVNSINRGAEEAVNRVDAAQKKMEVRFAALAEMHENRAAEISSSLQEIERRVEAVLNEFRDRLHSASASPQQQEDAADPPPKKSAETH